MAVQQKRPVLLWKATKRDKGAIQKEIYCFYGRDSVPQNAFDSYNLRCRAIEGLRCLRFGTLCMHMFNKFRDSKGNGPLEVWKPRKGMLKAIREMSGAAFTEYAREMQTMRFFMYTIREIADLVRNGRSNECREKLLGYLNEKGNVFRRMAAFSESEQLLIKKSLDDDFFSKI